MTPRPRNTLAATTLLMTAAHGWAVANSADAIALGKTVDGGASWIELEPRAVR